MKSKALVLATMLIIVIWGCKKEENQQPFVDPSSSGQFKASETLIFSDDVYTSDVAVYSATPMRGESFITLASPAPKMKLSSIKVRLSKFGSPTGYVKMFLYKTTGIWGLGIQKPTGNPLATSDSINVATALTTTGQGIVFTFSGINQYLMNVNTSYFAILCYKSGNSTNYLKLSMDDTGNTDGNHVRWGISGGIYVWIVENYRDMSFFVYGIN
jgi:hypothetical protein